MEGQIRKSTFFGLNENIAAALAAGLPLILTFVPHVSYFAWIVPLIAVIFERRSDFVRLCGGEAFLVSLMLLAASALSAFINQIAESISSWFVFGCAMFTSVIRIVFAVIMVILADKGYLHEEYNIPILTSLTKKMIKYNER